MPHIMLAYGAGTYLAEIPKRYGYATSQFPFTGTSVMLTLRPETNYRVEVVIFGGASEDASKVGKPDVLH